jgi:hypothetical protein
MSSEFTALAQVLEPIVEDPKGKASDIIDQMYRQGYRFVQRETRIEPLVYEPDPDRPGYLRFVRAKKLREVLDEIVDATGAYPAGCSEGLGLYPGMFANDPWPRAGRLVIFAVNGSSEGDWVHVQMQEDGRFKGLLLGKTFDGRDAAWKYARRLADLLEEH